MQEQRQKLIKNLLTVAPKHCDNCGAKYFEEDFKVIKSSAVNTVIHLKCRSCANAYMLNVMNPQNGMVGAQRTPLNIDLVDGQEIHKFASNNRVDKNEALDIQDKLQPFLNKADIARILKI